MYTVFVWVMPPDALKKKVVAKRLNYDICVALRLTE